MNETLGEKIQHLNQILKEYRNKGVKMKDIAELTGIAPSVLSSLYSTVIPSYINNLTRGMDCDIAIDEALKMVNNISHKKLIYTINSLEQNIHLIEANSNIKNTNSNELFNKIEKEATSNIALIEQYSGIYLSYSRSSYKDALKIEPYIIEAVEKGEVMPKVAFKNIDDQDFWGIGVFANQLGYILINELKKKGLGMRSISLQLPLFNKPKILKGIYLSHDYNHNPSARRIIFVKQSDDCSIDSFNKHKARTLSVDELNEQERAYYDYTCLQGDYITSMMYTSPEPDINELRKEKELLKIY